MKTKSHLATLDGLRGVAAFAVVVFHFSLNWKSGVILPKAYLAVDFFFVLSGFVIAKAYEEKLRENLSFLTFARVRLIRLYPLILLATVFAFVLIFSRNAWHAHQIFPAGSKTLLAQFGFGVSLLPFVFVASDQAFPLVPPAWSLFYELLANFLYAALLRYLTDLRLALLLLLAGGYLVYLSFTQGNINFGHFPVQFCAGAARVGFSFFAGVLLYRLHRRGLFANWPKIPGVVLAALLLLSFLPSGINFTCWYDLGCVFLLYPVLVAFGSYDRLPAKSVPFCLWLGRLSYPLYVLHWPVVVSNSYHFFYGLAGLRLVLATAGAVLVATLIAWLALILFDEPVRARLSGAKVLLLYRRLHETVARLGWVG